MRYGNSALNCQVPKVYLSFSEISLFLNETKMFFSALFVFSVCSFVSALQTITRVSITTTVLK